MEVECRIKEAGQIPQVKGRKKRIVGFAERGPSSLGQSAKKSVV